MKVIVKNNMQGSIPTLEQLSYGELALDAKHGKLYTKISTNPISGMYEENILQLNAPNIAATNQMIYDYLTNPDNSINGGTF